MSKPLLSIGIIFKNEIRCLERCLKSLQPLRDAIPCELVMADTGSNDGSRAVAEKYADILFDFPWINDFAAARNAVMDRCSGKWYVTVDADEWLDKDINQLVKFLEDPTRKENISFLIVRNYTSQVLAGNYTDFYASRIVRMSTGIRYKGTIHEQLNKEFKEAFGLDKTILHHDGYVGLASEAGREKRKRNMALLREELNKNPDNLRRRNQCMESSHGEPDHEDYVRLALDGVRKKLPDWRRFGPPIFRNAVMWATDRPIEELEALVEEARALFPNSMATKIDIEYMACNAFSREKNHEKAIIAGEAYVQAMEDYRANRLDLGDMIVVPLSSLSPLMENHARMILADSYFETGDLQRSMEHLTAVDIRELRSSDSRIYIRIMMNLQAQSGFDMSGHMLKLWNWIEDLDEVDIMKVQWRNELLADGGGTFLPSYRGAEEEKGYRHAYTVFLPLAGRFEMGTAARILETTVAAELEGLLGSVGNWNEFPIHALAHAIRCGARFPLPDKPLNIEQMDAYAIRLAQDEDGLRLLVERSARYDFSSNTQEFAWTRGMVLAAMRKFNWSSEEANVEQGMALIRAFAEIEKKYLPLCYAPEALKEENLFLLPAMHRFGFYCIRAFDALAREDTVEYVRLLRAGLAACESAKEAVKFLQEHTPELQVRPEPSAEMLALAEQIRTVLSNFAPGDPAVDILRHSEAYQKVAYIIEGLEPPVVGGQLQ